MFLKYMLVTTDTNSRNVDHMIWYIVSFKIQRCIVNDYVIPRDNPWNGPISCNTCPLSHHSKKMMFTVILSAGRLSTDDVGKV